MSATLLLQRQRRRRLMLRLLLLLLSMMTMMSTMLRTRDAGIQDRDELAQFVGGHDALHSLPMGEFDIPDAGMFQLVKTISQINKSPTDILALLRYTMSSVDNALQRFRNAKSAN
jgi:hypothetical protein